MIKKVLILLTVIILLQISCFAQFSLYVFPTIVLGDPYADTLINSRALMIKDGIRKIYSWQTSPAATKTYAAKTMYFNKNGNIEAMTISFDKSKDFSLVQNDTLFYDYKGRLTEMKRTDNKGNLYPRFITEYLNEREIKCSSSGGINSDTLVDYKYFNERGQMIRLKQIRKDQPTAYTSFFYNKDGLFDSIQHENSVWDTFIFKRTEKRKEKVIEMENPVFAYKWIYNLSGQCMKFRFTRKDLQNTTIASGNKGIFKTEVNYYYNLDGTLSKVTQKISNLPKTTIYYSYSN